ncbi:hypothetical protein ABZ345_28145 [Lentzea sp. NPDC005914]|uniref:hypothetical protein n=1 Tax=Lentzea sp. NPDC005914 TaxID=3154572 RepID=UPI00340719CA
MMLTVRPLVRRGPRRLQANADDETQDPRPVLIRRPPAPDRAGCSGRQRSPRPYVLRVEHGEDEGIRTGFLVQHHFLEWHRERVALLTNLTTRELPDTPVTFVRLPSLPLLAPTAGLLAQFLGRWYGPDYRGTLDVIADIDSLNHGLNLLNTELLHGCMLTTERVADAVLEGRLFGRGLRKIDLADDYDPALEIVTGIFARKGERDRYAADHPLNLVWEAFAAESPARAVPTTLPG